MIRSSLQRCPLLDEVHVPQIRHQCVIVFHQDEADISPDDQEWFYTVCVERGTHKLTAVGMSSVLLVSQDPG